MKTSFKILTGIMAMLLALFMIQCQQDQFVDPELDTLVETRAKPESIIGNNLSYPVIWADGAQLSLRGVQGEDPILEGEWAYVWGPEPLDPNFPIYSCSPNPDNPQLCFDGSIPGAGYDNLTIAYVQKDPNNIWQAGNREEEGRVNFIDWGDNLESVDWTTKSQVRTEVVLTKMLDIPMTQYEMRHVSGWGITEVHGLAVGLDDVVMEGPGDIATVYSDNARLTIQKLNVPREEITEGMLEWVTNSGWIETDPLGEDYINAPIFNAAIYENNGYSAEVNVKGKIIYGYTWNVRRLNEGEGDYRVTFSIDEGREGCTTTLEFAEILFPDEEIELLDSGSGGGATPVLVPEENLTYIDVRIIARNSGKGGGSGGGMGGGQGGGNGTPGGPQ